MKQNDTHNAKKRISTKAPQRPT